MSDARLDEINEDKFVTNKYPVLMVIETGISIVEGFCDEFSIAGGKRLGSWLKRIIMTDNRNPGLLPPVAKRPWVQVPQSYTAGGQRPWVLTGKSSSVKDH